jgi:glutathione peroxidase
MSIYDLVVKDSFMKDVRLSDYKGKVLLIVNTATGCGFTPQYDGLEKLYEEYREKGLEILDFPCNQFLNQAPGSNKEIAEFCQMKFGIAFKTFAKINVNGKNADPLYKLLRKQIPQSEPKKFFGFIKTALTGSSIEWNFTKFLVDRNGNVIRRFAPTVEPEKLKNIIEELL